MKKLTSIIVIFSAVMFFVPAVIFAASPIPPAWSPWSQKLPAAQRFQIVLDDAAVLDKETGLVWERSPSQDNYSWYGAVSHCIRLEMGGRKGWHLPTVEQLLSLVDTSAEGDVMLPTGHPFDTDCEAGGGCVTEFGYWSATTYASEPTDAWRVHFGDGHMGHDIKDWDGSLVWCVRGGQSYDAY